MKSITKKLIGKSLPLLIADSMRSSCAYFNGNFHPVKKGYIYRSAQINDNALEEVIEKYEIKTIVNLRGKNESAGWYEDEISICKKYGIDHYGIRLSAQSLPKKKTLLELFEVFDTAKYPLIIYCIGGADRTGLVSVAYKLQYEGETLKEALKQMSICYGHIPILKMIAMDNFFKLYKEFGNGRDLRTWVEEDYDEIRYKDYSKSKFEDLKSKVAIAI